MAMPHFQVTWTSKGTATIEADDEAEAEEILNNGLESQDTVMFDAFDVDEVDIVKCEPI